MLRTGALALGKCVMDNQAALTAALDAKTAAEARTSTAEANLLRLVRVLRAAARVLTR